MLATTNTYTGDTLISGGTLQLTSAQALQKSTLDTSGSGSLNFSGLTAATLGGLKGSGNLRLTNTANAAVALTVGNNNTNTTYAGSLSGSGSVNKIGAGALTLAGSNIYSGGTEVDNGTLVAANGGAAPPRAAETSHSTAGRWPAARAADRSQAASGSAPWLRKSPPAASTRSVH